MMNHIWYKIILLGLFFYSTAATAQTEDTAAEAAEPQVAAEADSLAASQEGKTADAQITQPASAQDESVLEKRLAEIEAKFEAKDATRRAENEALKQQIDELEQRQIMSMEESDSGDEKKLDIFGFFDLNFVKNFYDENSAYNELFNPYSSFMMSSVNLYFASQMTDVLSALVELKYTFLPLGNATGLSDDEEVYLYTANNTIVHRGEYRRIDTKVTDPFTTGSYHLGGVGIERVHLDWKPKDWFGIRAGRYLTPYGIWNVDHASPVILTARAPYMMIREMVPAAQTGLQFMGRVFPLDSVYLDYAVTLSNGRGPMDSVQDLDENKGLGLRLLANYSGASLTVSFGGYGYMGKYTNQARIKHIALGVDSTITDTLQPGLYADLESPLEVRMETKEAYDESLISLDLKLEMFGITLQSEFVTRKVIFKKPDFLSINETIFLGVPPAGSAPQYRDSSYVGQGIYVLAAYTLPLNMPVLITPYIMFDYNAPNDTQKYLNNKYYIAGINIKPSPFVTLKLEGNIIDPENEFYGGKLKTLLLQTAVSF